MEGETKTISKLRKLEHQTRNRFQTKLLLEIYCFVQKLQENIFQKQTKPTDCLYCDQSMKVQSPRNKLILCKYLVLWKTQPNLFQNCANWKTRQETAFKTNCVQRIISFCKNYKKSCLKGKQNQRNVFIVYKFANKVLENKANSIQISCIVEDTTKSISKLRELEDQARNCF